MDPRRLPRRLRALRVRLRPALEGPNSMMLDYWLSAIVTVGLLVYLVPRAGQAREILTPGNFLRSRYP